MEKPLACPKCHSTSLLKWGLGASGRQKYRCALCRRQFVAGSDHFLEPEKKAVVMRLIEAGVEPAKIREAIPDISLRWVYELRRRLKRDRQG
ncbi:MAG TPA: hypothetical protein PL061_12875 [Syntrophales bacterium]|nr:hypothetical protein [Syntrophales bacterium]HPC33841.1 hypothetical protein [Syntrophales bacterium]